jgi:acetylornithine deacetylase
LVNYICDFLSGYEIDTAKIYNEDRSKASIFYSIGKESQKGLIFSAHTDTVPVDISQWSSDPFTLNIRDNKYIGRGTTDMKGFISILLSLTPWLISNNLSNPFHVALSYDEEVGCLGVQTLIESIKNKIQEPKLVIVGEPTKLQIIDMHKSCHTYQTEFFGLKAHSCDPSWGCNAIYFASVFIEKLKEFEMQLKEENKDENFDPPYSTINIGVIQGGNAHNIVPDYVKILWQIRCLPDSDHKILLKGLFENIIPNIESDMKAKSKTAHIINKNISNILPLKKSTNSNIFDNLTTKTNTPSGVSYGTDAGYFSEQGWQTIVCGPGDIEQAHKSDEYILIEDIKSGMRFVENMVNCYLI